MEAVAYVDASLIALALAGGAAGALAGLIPGLHPNTLAMGLLLAGFSGLLDPATTVPLLLGLLGAWTFASIVPLIVLGVPEGDDAPALLPGQRMARQGKLVEALEASARGSLIGLAMGSLAAIGLGFAFASTGLGEALPMVTPWVQGLALMVLVVSDPGGLLRAGGVAVLAGWLGVVGLGLAVSSPFGLPATPLAPLFIGLFGLPALVQAARAGAPEGEALVGWPFVRPRRPGRAGVLPGVLGAGLGVVAGSVSGFTSGPATAIGVLIREGRDAEVLATTSAVNTSTACVATALLHGLGRTRTGVHAAQLALAPPAPGVASLVGDLSGLVAGGVVGLGMLWVAAGVAGRLARVVPRVAPGLVVVWVVVVVVSTGWGGFLVAGAAWSVARAAAAWGVRRSVLMACLLVPSLVSSLGLGG